jgi:hypothetical protein
MPAATPKPAPPGTLPGTTAAATRETATQVATPKAEPCRPPVAWSASDAPSRPSPATAVPTPIHSRLESLTAVVRSTSSASSPIPPADTACTSESGAKASAATYNAQPPSPAAKPISQRRFEKSSRSDRSGRRTVSGGSIEAAPC